MKPKPKNRASKDKKADSATNWDLIIKMVSALVAAAGVSFGIYQYYHHKNQERELALRNLQLQLYVKATSIASKFTQATTQQDAEETRKQFWEIYYGELSIVEDENVKQAMMNFGGALKAWERINAPPSDFFPPSEFVYFQDGTDKEGKTFEQLAYHLSQACKESLKQ
jgi:hypothetical protein